MIVGVPREIKADEYRVALMPVGASLLASDGHVVLIERGAGAEAGFDDEQYAAAGAEIVEGPQEVLARSEMIVKVKEPQEEETRQLRKGQIVFTFFHFASSRELTERCLKSGIAAVAYETLHDDHGRLPLLTPMSEVAGKMAVQEGAKYLERPIGGRGVLLGGIPGVAPANVLVLGGGVVGSSAARLAAGLGANVFIMDIDLKRLRYLDEVMPPNVTTLYCDPHAIEIHAALADLIIGAVLVPGGRAPMLITREMLRSMQKGTVIVDVCIDQGGCVETARPTSHHDPIYTVDGVVHYCVTNMPGAVSVTSTQGLCNATLPYVRELARMTLDEFIAVDSGHAAALNMRDGKLTNPAVIEAFPDLPHI